MLKNIHLYLLILYASTVLSASTNTFCYEFPDFLETNLLFQEYHYMFEDFNIHLDLPSLNIRSFMDALQTYALHTHFLYMFMVIGSTYSFLDLLALTSSQYFILMVYQIIIVSLLIYGCKYLEKKFTFRQIN